MIVHGNKPESPEIELYCHSEMREKKEQAMQERFAEHFETALQSLSDGLHKKGMTKRHEKVVERIGRLKETYARAAQHYEIKAIPDPETDKTQSIYWKRKEKPNTQATHPGVYCLRTNIDDRDEERLWKTYIMLTNLEAVFRSLKSELGMRPIYHHKEELEKWSILTQFSHSSTKSQFFQIMCGLDSYRF